MSLLLLSLVIAPQTFAQTATRPLTPAELSAAAETLKPGVDAATNGFSISIKAMPEETKRWLIGGNSKEKIWGVIGENYAFTGCRIMNADYSQLPTKADSNGVLTTALITKVAVGGEFQGPHNVSDRYLIIETNNALLGRVKCVLGNGAMLKNHQDRSQKNTNSGLIVGDVADQFGKYFEIVRNVSK